MEIHLLIPSILWLLLGVPLIFLAFHMRRDTATPRRWWMMAALRTIVVALLVVALADPGALRPAERHTVVHAIDASATLPVADVTRAVDQMIRTPTKPPAQQAGYVVFAENALSVETTSELARALRLRTPDGKSFIQGSGGTDLSRAIALAAAALPESACRDIVLVSDGRHTGDDLWPVVERLRQTGVRIHSVPMAVTVVRRTEVAELSLPNPLRANSPTPVALTVRASAPMSVRIGLSTDGQHFSWRAVQLPTGSSRWTMTAQFKHSGLQPLVVRIESQDGIQTQNTDWRSEVAVGAPLRILLIASDSTAVRSYVRMLSRQGFQVDVRMPEQLNDRSQSLDIFDTVVMNDPPSGLLSLMLQQRLEGYVREGGSLIFIAGENSHGRDGWNGTVLEHLLPVKFTGPRRHQDLDLLLLIDRSYSMRGHLLEIAKIASATAIDALDERHRAGVIAFDAKSHPIVPLQLRANAQAQLGQMGALTAEGQTNIYQALWAAYQTLRASKAPLRHVILLSDGNTAPIGFRTQATRLSTNEEAPPDSFEGLGARMAAEGISVSTVAIGDEPDLDLMNLIAEATGGSAYVVKSPSEVPALFAEESRRLTGDASIERRFQVQARLASEATAGINFLHAPPLLGITVGTARSRASVVLTGAEGHPLLATHSYGLGKVTAYLSDVSGRWSAPWQRWSDYERLWSQILRTHTKATVAEAGRFSTAIDHRGLWVTLNLADQSSFSTLLAQPMVSVTSAEGEVARSHLGLVAPGRYEARFNFSPDASQTYRAQLIDDGMQSENDLKSIASHSFRYAGVDSLRDSLADLDRLRKMTARTGGTLFSHMPEQLPACTAQSTQRISYAPWLCMMALLLYVSELAIRRIR